MTTATKAPMEADQLAALRAAKERLAEAQQERAKLDKEARAYSDELAQAQAKLDHLARTDRDQFDGSGQPKPKTAAAKAKQTIDAGKSSRWPAMIAGADERIASLDAEVRRLARPLTSELARAQYDEALEAKGEAMVLRDHLLAAIDKVDASRPHLLEIVG